MGVLNVTSDSFSDGGMYLDRPAAIRHGLRMAEAGADVVDVGGESSRPGAKPVPAEVEIDRVVPVIKELCGVVRVSVDTAKAEVARAALEAGATLLNDITASLERVAAEHGAGWIAMHMLGTPVTMQQQPRYGNVVEEVTSYLRARAEAGRAAGVGEVWLDPGIGFGKTVEHNLALLSGLREMVALGYPVLVGTSRKSFLGILTARDRPPPPASDRFEASLATATFALAQGAAMVRVHDVTATVQAARLVGA